MIIQLRGTSASGKSTIVRGVLKALGGGRPIFGAFGPRQPQAHVIEGRARPLYCSVLTSRTVARPRPAATCSARSGCRGLSACWIATRPAVTCCSKV